MTGRHQGPDSLIGIGLDTPAEAARHVQVSSAKILPRVDGYQQRLDLDLSIFPEDHTVQNFQADLLTKPQACPKGNLDLQLRSIDL